MAVSSSSTVSAANAAATATITGQTGQVARLYRIDAFTSAGTSTITVQDGGTTIWRSWPAEVVSTGRLIVVWTPQALMAQPGNNLVVTASAAGAGNTVTLNVQAEVR